MSQSNVEVELEELSHEKCSALGTLLGELCSLPRTTAIMRHVDKG